MAVSLPTTPSPRDIVTNYVAAGGVLESALGGPSQEIVRFGDRLSLEVQLPPMKIATARAWIAARMAARATGDTLVLTVPQPGGGPTGRTGTGTSGSTTLTASSGASIIAGMRFSFTVGGVIYHHVVTNVAGNTLTIAPRLRASPSSAALNFAAPQIEGRITDNAMWSETLAEIAGLSFTLTEAR